MRFTLNTLSQESREALGSDHFYAFDAHFVHVDGDTVWAEEHDNYADQLKDFRHKTQKSVGFVCELPVPVSKEIRRVIGQRG